VLSKKTEAVRQPGLEDLQAKPAWEEAWALRIPPREVVVKAGAVPIKSGPAVVEVERVGRVSVRIAREDAPGRLRREAAAREPAWSAKVRLPRQREYGYLPAVPARARGSGEQDS
jgi:hypothetical protein